MIALSKRLKCIAEMVPVCEVLADVGTDHAYLPVWLVQNGRAGHVLATDIGEGPLRRARETVEAWALTDHIETIRADGLQFPGADRSDAITICGMGGETMISILEAAPWTGERRRLILQPQSKLPELERWLREHRYAAQDARLCRDAGKLYLAISVLGGEAWTRGCEEWLLYRRDLMLPEYIRRERAKTERSLSGLRCADTERSAEIRAAERRLTALSRLEREMETW